MRISDWSSDVCSSDLHAPGLPRARVDRQRLQLHPQLLAAADVPVETCVEMPLTALEAADQVVVLPDQPVGRAVGIEAGVEAERVADEIGGLELDRIADLVVAREPAADRIHLEVVGPVALARPVVLEPGVEVRRQFHTALATGEPGVPPGTVAVLSEARRVG